NPNNPDDPNNPNNPDDPNNPNNPDDPNNPNNPDDPNNPNNPDDPNNPSGQAGPLETTLGNTGQVVDNVLPVGVSDTLGNLGGQRDKVVEPVLGTVTGLTQQVGATTGLGVPVDGLLVQVGGTVSNLGQTISGVGLPGGLGVGVGGLVDGLGNSVASLGGLLNAPADGSNPLTNVLDNATGALGNLTLALGAEGGLLQPLTDVLGGALGGGNGDNAAPVLEPTLVNAGQAVDNLLPVGLSEPLGGVGNTLDGIVSPIATTLRSEEHTSELQ